jgi:DNA-binding response OmpR family regulator
MLDAVNMPACTQAHSQESPIAGQLHCTRECLMEILQRPLILVVEDTPRDRELLSSVLEREGYEVVSAFDGDRARDLAARMNPVLILLDVLLPGMDGLEVCRRLKEDALTRAIPVIFLTGQSASDQVLAGFEAGAADYVTKPFRIMELLARVHVHVELHRVRNEVRVLHGILPTCSNCKKIRDEQGTWHQIESYITQRSEAQFSHGLCPDCIPQFFPDFHRPMA